MLRTLSALLFAAALTSGAQPLYDPATLCEIARCESLCHQPMLRSGTAPPHRGFDMRYMRAHCP